MKRKKKEAVGEDRDKLKEEIAKLEARLAAPPPSSGGAQAYAGYTDLTKDGGVLIKFEKPGVCVCVHLYMEERACCLFESICRICP